MEKINLPPFYIGQKVEYITGKRMPKGTKVIVTALSMCKCGSWSISFDGSRVFNCLGHSGFYCTTCDGTLTTKNYIDFWKATSFRSLQEQPMPLLTFEKIKENELQKTEPQHLILN